MKNQQDHAASDTGAPPQNAVIADPHVQIAPPPLPEAAPEPKPEEDAAAVSSLMTLIEGELSHLQATLTKLEHDNPEGNEVNEARGLLTKLESAKAAVTPYVGKGKMPPTVGDNARAQIRDVAHFLIEHGDGEESTAYGGRVLATLEAEHKKQEATKKKPTILKPQIKQANDPAPLTPLERKAAIIARHAAEARAAMELLHVTAPARHRAHELDTEANEDEKEQQREATENRRRRKTPRKLVTMVKQNEESRVRDVYWSTTALIGSTEHARDTAHRLELGMRNAKTKEEYDYYYTESGDAVARHVLGRTFIDQEIEKQIPELKRIGFHVTDQEDVIRQLIANGAFTADRRSWWYSADYNAAWSDENVKRIDMNGDGQISANELSVALSTPDRALSVTAATHARRNAIASGQPVPDVAVAISGSVASSGSHWDLNRDGRINGDEYRAAIRKAGHALNGGTGKDGIVNQQEMTFNLTWIAIEDRLRELDKNHDGKTSVAELKAAGINAAAWDKDKNGFVSVNEVSGMLKGVTFSQVDTGAEFKQAMPHTVAPVAQPSHRLPKSH